ncbi:MAG: cytosine permease [Actinobacteria bacterium]|nr:cytosine permease [Actinomycetota bacterium]
MATTVERLGRALEREAPAWGIRPVPEEHRRFSGLDMAVLWGDLSVGLLVMVTGALLIVLGAGLRDAVLAIVVGSVLGCGALALVGTAGAREGVPGMVLFRPVLGLRGSYLPTALNLAQLVGWTAFEFWAMARVANAVSIGLFGLDAYPLWLVAVAVVATLLALGGPILVVRRWLERFAVYVVLGVGAWLSYRVVGEADLGTLWGTEGTGGLPFWLAVDLVVVMPLSWLPLVADYNRFARRGVSSFAGTFWGYLGGNAWFYALGALLVLAVGADATVDGVGGAVITLAGGTVVLIALLVGESDQAFADIYSASVSVQNVAPRAPQRGLVVAVAGVALLMAWFLTMEAYEFFLFLIGSVFAPLFGVFAAHYFVRHRARYGEEELFGPRAAGVRWRALVPWAVGFLLYHWSVPTGPQWWLSAAETLYAGWLRLPFPLAGSALGASLPSFLGAFLLALVLPPGRRAGGPNGGGRLGEP